MTTCVLYYANGTTNKGNGKDNMVSECTYKEGYITRIETK